MRRRSGVSAAFAAAGVLGAVLGACTASSQDVRPPEDKLFFPTGIGVGGGALFVVNANSELRFDSGTISVIDLKQVKTVVDAWVNTGTQGGCAPDASQPETLVCDASVFLKLGAGARIGNFATDLAVQDFTAVEPGSNKLRVIVPTRGDPSIAWADFDATTLTLSCSDASGFALCDDAHRLTFVNNDPAQIALPEEPFGVFAGVDKSVDASGKTQVHGYAMVTHQANAAVTLVDSPPGDFARIGDITFGIFDADPNTGTRAASGVSARQNSDGSPIIYVASRTDNRVQTFNLGRPVNGALPFLLPSTFFLLDQFGGNAGSSVDARGITFSPGGDRMYLVDRFPPSLQVFDTSLTETGVPRNRLSGVSDLCRQASNVTALDSGAGERAYVTCFQTGELYVIDPTGATRIEDIVTVGRGPYAIASSLANKQLFISNFLDDTIAVVDIDPSHTTQNQVVLRIGQPRAL